MADRKYTIYLVDSMGIDAPERIGTYVGNIAGLKNRLIGLQSAYCEEGERPPEIHEIDTDEYKAIEAFSGVDYSHIARVSKFND